MGGFQGDLKSLSAPELGAPASGDVQVKAGCT
jgi:hypothetical protein